MFYEGFDVMKAGLNANEWLIRDGARKQHLLAGLTHLAVEAAARNGVFAAAGEGQRQQALALRERMRKTTGEEARQRPGANPQPSKTRTQG
jgi:hypothetical protein